MSDGPGPNGPSENSPEDRLNSWKEIAAYLRYSERTVRRWEQEGLPIHRHGHKKKAAIYAYKPEIDAWWNNGRSRLEPHDQSQPGPRRRFPWRHLGAALVAAFLLAAVFLALEASRLGISASGKVRAVAILPLRNAPGNQAEDFFVDGVTDSLTTDLATIESLRVLSSGSAMHYKATTKSLPEIGRELQADALVEGSVERSGDSVRITTRLMNSGTGKQVWTGTYERSTGDILGLQEDIASALAEQIERRMGGPRPGDPGRTEAVNPQAYETYLRGNSYFDSGDILKSIDFYNQAVKLDPDYGFTYAQMAHAYFFRAFFGSLSPQEGWGKVKQMATLAMQRDGHIPEGHGALALALQHYDWDFPGAEREFQRALELDPSDADIRHDYAHYLMAMGRVDESMEQTKRAVELDPIGTTLTSCMCWHSFAARRYDEATQLASQFLDSHPDNTWEHTILGWTYEQRGMPNEAIAQLEDAVTETGGRSFFLAALGHAYAMAGRRRDAEQVLQTLFERSKTSYVSAFDVATIYAGLGEKDNAFLWLNKAAAEHSSFLVYSKWEPRLDPLRSDPRFNALLTRIGLPTT